MKIQLNNIKYKYMYRRVILLHQIIVKSDNIIKNIHVIKA